MNKHNNDHSNSFALLLAALSIAVSLSACGGMEPGDEGLEMTDDELTVGGPVILPADPCTTQVMDDFRVLVPGANTVSTASPDANYAFRAGCKYWITDFYVMAANSGSVGIGGSHVNHQALSPAQCDNATATVYVYKRAPGTNTFVYQTAYTTGSVYYSFVGCSIDVTGGTDFAQVARPTSGVDVYRVAVSTKIGTRPARASATASQLPIIR